MSERFDKFTEGARKVLQLAQEEATRFKHNYIGTEHLLLGLTRETDGLAARVLHELGVDVNKVRSAAEFITGKGEQSVRGDVGLTPRAKKVIEYSVDEARRLRHDYIGTEHLLLGLLREGEGVAAGVLESLGVLLDVARGAVIRALEAEANAGPGPSPLRGVLQPFERLRRRGTAARVTTDPWPAFGTSPSVTQVDAILQDLDRLTDEIAYRRFASGPGYECGVTRFLPRPEADARQITHTDKDVVCQVIKGRGQLRTAAQTQDLTPGALCRIPAGTPHDFTAIDEPLVLFYVSVSVG